MISDKIRPHHLERKALLYVRQSSAHQVLHNRESSALQYAMGDRLAGLGWSQIEVIDDDLGRSARQGWRRLCARSLPLCPQQPRLAATDRDVSRGRHGAGGQETVYAPRHGNDRLLLGLKGSLNEYELDLLCQRSLAARYEKARRGELVVAAPVAS
jgi:DNA invertase Pin-like site-specific DNA recombinase